MPFKRSPSRTHPDILISYCMHCGQFIGASRRQHLLTFVEAVHRCSEVSPKRPSPGWWQVDEESGSVISSQTRRKER